MRRFAVRATFIALMLTVTASMKANIYNKAIIDGYDCAGDMTTTNCFSAGTYTGPSTEACTAKASNSQRCRDCSVRILPDGQPADYNTCNFVARSAACDCKYDAEYSRKCISNSASRCSYSW